MRLIRIALKGFCGRPMRIWRERGRERKCSSFTCRSADQPRERARCTPRGIRIRRFLLSPSLPPSPAHSSTLRPPCPSFPRQSSPNSEGGRLRCTGRRPRSTGTRSSLAYMQRGGCRSSRSRPLSVLAAFLPAPCTPAPPLPHPASLVRAVRGWFWQDKIKIALHMGAQGGI